MAKTKSNARRRRTRRAGREVTRQAAQSVEGVIIGQRRSDREFAGSTSVARGFSPNAASDTGQDLAAKVAKEATTGVTYPRFDDGSSCAVDYREVPVAAEGGRVITKRIAVPVRNATVGRRAEAYRAIVEQRRFIPETVEALAFPDVWTRDDVLNWMGYGLTVMAMLPMGDIYPADARAQSLPTVNDVVETYGWGEVNIKETPSITDIALMDIVLTWPPRIEDEKERKALLLYCRGKTSAEISRKLGYRSREWGGKKAKAAAQRLAEAMNTEAKNPCPEKCDNHRIR